MPNDTLGAELHVGDFVTTAELNRYRIVRMDDDGDGFDFIVVSDMDGRERQMLPALVLRSRRQSWE